MRALLLFVVALAAVAQEPRLANPSFEETVNLPADHAALKAGWQLDAARLAPVGWSLNTAYPGMLAMPLDGTRVLSLTAPAGRDAHLYQLVAGLQAGYWYKFSARSRGAAAKLLIYEYRSSGLRAFTLADSVGGGAWREVTGYYGPVGDDFQRAALALTASPDQTVFYDDLRIESLALPEPAAGLPDIVLETAATRLVLTGQGRVKSLLDLGGRQELASPEIAMPVLTALAGGAPRPLHALTRDGALLRAQFVEPELTATLRVTARPRHLLFEVVEAAQGIDELRLEFAVARRDVQATTCNATYDAYFGICCFGTTYNVQNRRTALSAQTVALGGRCVQAHGLAGAGFAFVAAPGGEFRDAIREAERANGLPSPARDGVWLRDSAAVRKSYLFTTGTTEADLDTLIEYAQIGGFATMLWLKNDWLANHGHYDINTANFPDALASIKRGVEKLHAAGMEAGVHLFGPTISPNDPYVTPVPDDRLASVECPPLAEAVDATSTTITLSAPPVLPPIGPSSRAFPGQYLRLGDELVQWGQAETGPPFRYLNCRRGALGTTAAAHPAGAAVKGLPALWGFFCIDAETSLADEVTDRLATVVREAGFDFLYLDAAEGHNGPYLDGWFASNKLHGELYRKIGRDDLLYQTSQGAGVDYLFHLVPRSASADGHGDIKGYLDDRWPGIAAMRPNFTRADIGWYYWFREVRPDQIEYVCAKALGIDGSISLETSREALERLAQSRRMMEMIGRWERCRAANVLDAGTKAILLEQQRDFRLFDDGHGGWQLYEAKYEEPRQVERLDGEQNRWEIVNDRTTPVALAIELERGQREQSAAAYDAPEAVTLPAIDDAERWRLGPENDYAKYVVGGEAQPSGPGIARRGVSQSVARGDEPGPGGQPTLAFAAENSGGDQGWSGIGHRFAAPLDLSACPLFAVWVEGDQRDEQLRIQLRDRQGGYVDTVATISFAGWRLVTFPLAKPGFDPTQVEFLMLFFSNLRARQQVVVQLSGPRAVPAAPMPEPTGLRLRVDDRDIPLVDSLPAGTALTAGEPLGARFWPGGMQPGRPLTIGDDLTLAPGRHEVVLSCDDPGSFGGDLSVLLSQLWPLSR